jgi:hypothetical protein
MGAVLAGDLGGQKMTLEIAELTLRVKAEAEKADKFLEVAQKIEEESDYSDAMLSMDRTYAEGFSDALGLVLSILKGTI